MVMLHSLFVLLLLTLARPGHRFEDVPGVRRHLVRKCSKGQVVHISKDHKEPSGRSRKLDRTPHEVSHLCREGGGEKERGSLFCDEDKFR